MSAVPLEEIARRRAAILETVARASAAARRDPAGVALMAVTKGQSAQTVDNGARAGLTLFGENRVQEGVAKIEALRSTWPALEWRLIGPLQTNKAKTALQYFQVFESVDRERLAARLESLLAAEGRLLPALVEVNIGREPSKSGVLPEEADRLFEAAREWPHLALRGLMAVPPHEDDPEKSRPHFRALARLREELSSRFGLPLPELSMGMSHDYAVAVEEGATEIRVGTALFGPREPQA
jgi:pyridoxal phosphate enzyme (YggS family)